MREVQTLTCIRKTAVASISAACMFWAANSNADETYRLVQALGNSERVSAKGLSKAECEARKRDLKAVSEAIGTTNDRSGRGSITCLPDSLFKD
jgi:hypothetical protein